MNEGVNVYLPILQQPVLEKPLCVLETPERMHKKNSQHLSKDCCLERKLKDSNSLLDTENTSLDAQFGLFDSCLGDV